MKKHDTIATRFSIILTKLNNGEKLTVEELAKEFNVTKRTIQRDLNERFRGIPLKKENNTYYLEPQYLGKFNLDDLHSVAHLSGLNKMFPSFDRAFVAHLLDKEVAHTYLIKTHNFEDISHKIEAFKLLESAIIETKVLELVYRDKKRSVHPYKLANIKGIWYLIALQEGIIKTFTFSKISQLKITNATFEIDDQIMHKIEDDDSLWFSNNKTEVILKIDASIAQYFTRRKVLPYQTIIEEQNDGSLLVSTQMTFEREILQMVQYWIPNVKIVAPISLAKRLQDVLTVYLD